MGDLKGTIIQTTPRAFLRLSDDFLRDAQVKFVELGIESYNDHVLETYRKPSRTKEIDEATNRFRHIDAQLIPNIIIGFPEETKESYQKTLHYIERNQDVVSHMNIYNLAIYKQAEIASRVKAEANDLNELVLEKSFHKDKEAHRWFYDEVFSLGLEILK
jgi:radical SAM superfamily enzyme